MLGVVGKIYINAFYPAALDSLKRKLKFAILAFVVKMSDELKCVIVTRVAKIKAF